MGVCECEALSSGGCAARPAGGFEDVSFPSGWVLRVSDTSVSCDSERASLDTIKVALVEVEVEVVVVEVAVYGRSKQ